MGATTPIFALPYPTGTDRVMDGDNAIQALAEKVELLLGPAIGAPSGFRNVIRNGDMTVAQRGAGNFTAPTYGVDGWYIDKAGAAALVSARMVQPLGVTAAKYAHRTVVTGSAAAADYALLVHRIEGVHTLAGKQVTLSFLAAATTGTPKIGVEIVQQFGTGGSPSADVSISAAAAVTISATWTRYSVTLTLPAITSKTLGSNGNDRLSLFLWLSAGADWAARASSIGHQNATIDITDVQLELGPTATPFERLPQQQQLAWCQRYFWRMGAGEAASVGHGPGLCTATNGGIISITFPVQMRAVPTNPTAGQFAGWYLYGASGSTFNLSALAVFAMGFTSGHLSFSVAGTPLGNGGLVLLTNAGTPGIFDLSAEL